MEYLRNARRSRDGGGRRLAGRRVVSKQTKPCLAFLPFRPLDLHAHSRLAGRIYHGEYQMQPSPISAKNANANAGIIFFNSVSIGRLRTRHDSHPQILNKPPAAAQAIHHRRPPPLPTQRLQGGTLRKARVDLQKQQGPRRDVWLPNSLWWRTIDWLCADLRLGGGAKEV